MSIHIAAQKGDIADKILLPGDPLRAKFIAENFLENPVLFNEIRNMVIRAPIKVSVCQSWELVWGCPLFPSMRMN